MRDYILIEDLAADDRPREKALRNGISSLSNAELIAIIFGNGIKGKSVLTMSQELIARNNGRLSDIARKGIRETVKENPGIGPAKAISLAAAIELGMRCQAEMPPERVRIVDSSTVHTLMRSKLQLLNHEEFWIVMLSRANLVIDTMRVSQGGAAGTLVDPKILYKRVLEYGDVVSGIILVHNHPSGTLRPSIEDDRLTKRIKEGGELLDIKVLDHLIITSSGYYSYSDEGRL
ncbi:MAG: DNA repair protein RadC [Muribaculum sp.]|nr:DNA repair protein RadC [Muribaculum sp.]